jgi:alginate O-acetyltransferase complex protein AlgI
MLIANSLALPADQIFALPADELSLATSWFGMVCYTLQIYFDFSGYSDMAVGMGKMFGFRFLENFDFPYTAQSLRDFWRRWHISLSTWFRDYVYIPLGGNRVSEARNHLNLVIVFFLCGLWHGASWTFVIWGLYHGIFLVLERTRFGIWEAKLPRVLRHLYALLVVMTGWVLFRSDTFTGAQNYFLALAGLSHAAAPQPLARYISNRVIWALAFGGPFCAPLWGKTKSRCAQLAGKIPSQYQTGVRVFGAGLEVTIVIGLLVISAIWLAGGTYHPFIYFRF